MLTWKGVSPGEPERKSPQRLYLTETLTERLWSPMVILGLILLIIGLVASISILWIIGLILIIVGLILNFVPVGGTRRRWY